MEKVAPWPKLDESGGAAADLSKKASIPSDIVSAEDEDFEFAFSVESDPDAFPDVTADEIFGNGRILPVYPIFNCYLADGSDTARDDSKLATRFSAQLDLDSERSSPSPILFESEDLDQPSKVESAPESVPRSKDPWRKSSSTGSSGSRKSKIRNLLVGRSHSDGKERFVLVPLLEDRRNKEEEKKKALWKIKAPSKAVMAEAEKKKKGEALKEMDIVTAHRIFYSKINSGGGSPVTAVNTRRSFLPYRQELFGGIFGNAKHYPFMR